MTETNIDNSVLTVDLITTDDQNSAENKKLIRGNYKTWKNDHNEEGKTSLDTIVDWLAERDNYSKYKGSLKTPGESNKKTAYCKNIAEILVATGHKQRDFKGIMSQITELESKFKTAVNELTKCANTNNLVNIDISGDHNETVVDEKGNRKTLKDIVKKKFKYFYILRSVFMGWDESSEIGSSESTSHDISTSPSSSKRQREHEEQFFDAPDTQTRDDARVQVNNLQPKPVVIDFQNDKHANKEKAVAIQHNNSTNNHTSNQSHPFPIFPAFNQHTPFQHPPQQYHIIAPNDSEQARKRQKPAQNQQVERYGQPANTIPEEQRGAVARPRTAEDKHLMLEEERLSLENQRLLLDERRMMLEEKKEERLAFIAALEKLKPEDPRYSELLNLFMKKQLPFGCNEQ